MLLKTSQCAATENWVGGRVDLKVRQKMKNNIHCNKYNIGVGTKSSSKTTLSTEHERVLLHRHSTKSCESNAIANYISALPLNSLDINTMGPEISLAIGIKTCNHTLHQ